MSGLCRVRDMTNHLWNAAVGFLSRRRGWTRAIVIGLYSFVVIALALGIWRERAVVLQLLGRLTPRVLMGTFAIYSVDLMLAVIVWYLIMARLSGIKSFRLHFGVYCVTNLARRLPGVLWHVVGRAYMYEREGISKATVSIGSVIESVLVPVSGVIVYFLSMPFRSQSGLISPVWLVGVVVIGAILISPSFLNMLYNWMGRPGKIPVGYSNLLLWSAMFMVIWTVGGFITYFLAVAVEPSSSTHVLYIISSWALAGSLSSLVVFLPTGLGLLEISLAVMLSQVMPLTSAVFVVVFLRLLLTSFEFIWGVIALMLT